MFPLVSCCANEMFLRDWLWCHARTAKFIILNAKFLVFNTQFLVLNTKFIILNTKLTHAGRLVWLEWWWPSVVRSLR